MVSTPPIVAVPLSRRGRNGRDCFLRTRLRWCPLLCSALLLPRRQSGHPKRTAPHHLEVLRANTDNDRLPCSQRAVCRLNTVPRPTTWTLLPSTASSGAESRSVRAFPDQVNCEIRELSQCKPIHLPRCGGVFGLRRLRLTNHRAKPVPEVGRHGGAEDSTHDPGRLDRAGLGND